MAGRELLYNVLICQVIARGYHRQHITPRCTLKIYLQKAFDSVHWDFLCEILKELKFPTTFIHWVMTCVTSVTFNIYLNGLDHGSFKRRRGPRQGYPLSPLLFLTCMEYLSRLLSIISNEHFFKYHPHYSKLKLTHSMFANDLIFFLYG